MALRGLRRVFGDTVALEGLDLEIERGDFVVLLGPNGAGKTTALKIITGLLRPSAGEVQLLGRNLARDGAEVRRRVGYVPDRPALIPKLTGREYLELVAELHGMPVERARGRMVELVGVYRLAGALDRLIEGYSLGMKQKLALVGGLLSEPELLVLDEPWTGLDPIATRIVADDLARRNREGLTVLLSTHSLVQAERIARRWAIIAQGRLLALGTPQDLCARHGVADLETLFLRLAGPDESSIGRAVNEG